MRYQSFFGLWGVFYIPITVTNTYSQDSKIFTDVQEEICKWTHMTVVCYFLRAHESSTCLGTVHDLPANRLGFQDGTNALPLLKGQGKLVLNHVSLTDVSATVRKQTKRKLVMTLPLLKIICGVHFG